MCGLRTCSPSLAKSADRMEGDTMTSFLENLHWYGQFVISARDEADHRVDSGKHLHSGRAARCTCTVELPKRITTQNSTQ